MPDGLIYALGVLSGAVLIAAVRKHVIKAEKAAKKRAYDEYCYHQSIRTEAFNRGYDRAKQDYRNMSEVERLADTFRNRNVKMQFREVKPS